MEALYAIGGGAKSREWLQIKADITGKRFTNLEVPEAGCLGAAIRAGKGIGIYSSSLCWKERSICYGGQA